MRLHPLTRHEVPTRTLNGGDTSRVSGPRSPAGARARPAQRRERQTMRGSQVLSAPRPGTDAGRCPGGGERAPGCRHRNSQNKKANYPSPAATWLACKLQVGIRGDPGPLRTSNSWPLVGSLALGLGARSLRPDTAPGRGLSVLLAACLACLWGRDFSLFPRSTT